MEQTREEIVARLNRAVRSALPVDITALKDGETKVLALVKVTRVDSTDRISDGLQGCATVTTRDNYSVLVPFALIESVRSYEVVPELEGRLTPEEKEALESVIGAGMVEIGGGPWEADDPIRTACKKLGLEPTGWHGEKVLDV